MGYLLPLLHRYKFVMLSMPLRIRHRTLQEVTPTLTQPEGLKETSRPQIDISDAKRFW